MFPHTTDVSHFCGNVVHRLCYDGFLIQYTYVVFWAAPFHEWLSVTLIQLCKVTVESCDFFLLSFIKIFKLSKLQLYSEGNMQ